MLGSKGAELEFSHVRLIDAEEENADEGENNNGEEGETDIDDGQHRQLLPQTWFLESFLEYVHSFRYQALRPTFTGPVFLRGSSGVLG